MVGPPLSPPYKALPWFILAYVFICSLIYTDNGPFTGHIVGFDDQSRMTQVLQWINGGSWYDRVITRVNAPEGFHTIWARIVDVPIALTIVIAQIFTDQRTAALAASIILPTIELALLFAAAGYFARPIAGKKEKRLVLLFIMFTTVLNHRNFSLAGFHLGEASHHAWYGILNVLMFGAAVRVIMGVPGPKPKWMLGLAIALLLAVGIEGFPMIAGMVATISTLSWLFNREHLALRGAKAVGIGSALTLLLLPMHVPPTQLLTPSFSQPSIIGPLMTAIAAGFLFAQYHIIKQTKQRAISATLLVALTGIITLTLLQAFPEILSGGTAGLSPNERQLAATEHPEVWTMWRAVSQDPIDYLSLVMPSLIAIATGLLSIRSTTNTRRRIIYTAYTGFAAVPSTLTQLYWRYIHHTQTAICPLLLHAWQKLRTRFANIKYPRTIATLLFIAIAPFWFILLPVIEMNLPLLPHVVFFPAKIYTQPYACDALTLTDFLNRHYPPATNINVPDWDSATFIYETNLHVDFLSNYPSNDHFIDNRIFFQTQNLETAKRIAIQHGFDLVAACTNIPMSQEVAASRPYREPSMIERIRERTQPNWLKPVTLNFPTRFRLFEVDKAALKQGN